MLKTFTNDFKELMNDLKLLKMLKKIFINSKNV